MECRESRVLGGGLPPFLSVPAILWCKVIQILKVWASERVIWEIATEILEVKSSGSKDWL